MKKLSLVLLALALPAAILVPAAEAAAQDRAGRAFARVDANGDGVVDPDEVTKLRGAMFDRADADHDGKLTPEELKAFAEHVRELAQQRR